MAENTQSIDAFNSLRFINLNIIIIMLNTSTVEDFERLVIKYSNNVIQDPVNNKVSLRVEKSGSQSPDFI